METLLLLLLLLRLGPFDVPVRYSLLSLDSSSLRRFRMDLVTAPICRDTMAAPLYSNVNEAEGGLGGGRSGVIDTGGGEEELEDTGKSLW